MYSSSHLHRVLAMERQRELLAAAERDRRSRAVAQSAAPPKRARRVAVFVPRVRLVRWARAR